MARHHGKGEEEEVDGATTGNERRSLLHPKEEAILENTMNWVENVVIGLNLCPFAERPFAVDKSLHIDIISTDDVEEILSYVLAECYIRQDQQGSTSLLVCPNLYPDDFYSFLEIHNMLTEGILIDQELDDDIQIAPFHPLFEFSESEEESDEADATDGVDGALSNHPAPPRKEDDVENYTNRSPYPIFHVLRQEDVTYAVDALQGDASKVWKRNIRLLHSLHAEFDGSGGSTDQGSQGVEHSSIRLEDIMSGQNLNEANQERVENVLQNLRNEMKEGNID